MRAGLITSAASNNVRIILRTQQGSDSYAFLMAIQHPQGTLP